MADAGAAPQATSLDDVPDLALQRIALFLGGFPLYYRAGNRRVTKARSGNLDVAACARDLCALACTATRYRRAVDARSRRVRVCAG